MPVFEDPDRTHMNFPQDHPLHAGYDAGPHLDEADAILVVEADAPWFPALKSPRPETPLIQVGLDPLFSRYPIRGFRSDVALAGAPRLTLDALAEAVKPRAASIRPSPAAPGAWETEHRRQRDGVGGAAARGAETPPDRHGLGLAVPRRLIDDKTIVVNEYDLDTTQTTLSHARARYFGQSPAGGLGWGLGAALGRQARRARHTVICCVGDGAYIFGTPTARTGPRARTTCPCST